MHDRYSSLVLKVDILAGTREKQAAIEMAMLATDMGMIVESSHNGTTMRAWPGAGWEKTLEEFEREKRL